MTERIVLRAGQQAPGLSPGITIEAGSVGVLITDSDVLTFRRVLAGQGVTRANDNSWWVGPPDDLQLFIREGAPAPGLPGEFIGGLVGSSIRINDLGYGSITERLANNSRDVAIWAGTPGDLELVAFGGFPAPETDGLTFRITGSAAVMETNELVLGIGFDDPATGLPAGAGLYRGARDNLNLIIGPGPLSIFEDDELIKLSSPFVNRTGDAVMTAILSNGLGIERRAIIKVDLDDPSQTTLVVAEGDPAPGSTSYFAQIIDTGRINDRGDILFYGKLPGAEEEDFIDGLWMKPADGPLYLVAREGQTIDVPTNNGISPRVIDGIFSASQLSSDASVAFHLRFTDNTNGLFVARQVAVPEPHGIVLSLLGAVLILVVCRIPYKNNCPESQQRMGSSQPPAAENRRTNR